ncbi:MAG: DUF3971 domain-containing protein [Halioglobus sp.]
MRNRIFNRLGDILWGAIVLLLVLLAVYVSVGRLLVANVSGFRTGILQELNARAPFTVDAREVSGEWQSFSPVIVLTGLRLRIPGSSSPPLELSEGRIGIDVLNSLRTWSLQMNRIVLDGLSLRGELSAEGELRLTGLDGRGEDAAGQLQEFLLNVERVSLRRNRLLLTMPSGEVRDFGLDLQLSREGSLRRATATLTSSRGARIAIIAEGVGNPFRSELFTGQVYLSMQATDLGAVKDLLAERAFPIWTDGVVDLQVWLTWDRGQPSVVSRFEGRDLVIAGTDGSWRVPLDRVDLKARLARRNDRWTLFVSDLEVANRGVETTVPGLQLDLWDNSLRLRASEISLEPLTAIFAGEQPVPEPLRRVVTALDPRGLLPALQVSIGNIQQPGETWELQANFDRLAVNSYEGAPGVTSATGFARLVPGGGTVVLDSRMLSLAFPEVYHEPLRFDELHGTVKLDWDTDTVRIDSGLLTTHGEEGTAKVLFGLNIPLAASEYGIEMNLLVGLQHSNAIHRFKYIPYVLDPALLGWLADSIGEGRIEQGAFLWRGSLAHNAAPLRTVQLAFNVAETPLRYHPKWPPVLVKEGIVLIDGSEVSVWTDHAQLFDSRVENLSVETRLNHSDQVELALKGRIVGPAADGLKVLNESPLSGVVGPTFSSWTVTGELETDLSLQMNLSDTSLAPSVDVITRWHDASLLVTPGALEINGINGEFTYSTRDGFRASSLQGSLWGKSISARVEQQDPVDGSGYDPSGSVVDLRFLGQVDVAALRRWLHLDPLGFASGQSDIDATIRLAPGHPPLLTLDSDLQGVILDLPAPWAKRADELRHLYLEMPLRQDDSQLFLQLGQELQFKLNVGKAGVNGGALGVNQEPLAAQAGVLRVTGDAPLIQGDQWLAFARKYFGGDAAVSTTAAPATATDGTQNVEAAGQPEGSSPRGAAPQLVIDGLRADTLVIAEQALQDVIVSLTLDSARWNLSVDTDWLRGDLAVVHDGDPSRLDVAYLDVDRLPDFKLPGGEGGAAGIADVKGVEPERPFPTVQVNLRNLFQSGQRLGELTFELQGTGSVYTAEKVTGELAGLRLSAASPGRLVWRRGGVPQTELQAQLDFEDLGGTLGYFGYQRIMETQGGSLQVDLRWPGAPQDFSLGQGRGSVQVNIGKGSFLEATPGATGALRVVSILNLADIVRRLSLTQMFESGIPFDSVKGEVDVHDGLLEVTRMDVKGGRVPVQRCFRCGEQAAGW